MKRIRLDIALHQRGMAESRARAKALIMAGRIKVDGQVQTKAGLLVDQGATIEMSGGIGYVSRGGIKLERALDAFGVDVAGRVCIDVGASTGGFTHCLLSRGAARVYALDVGYGQLHWSLRSDPSVIPMERINVRYVKPENLPERVDMATIDVSFISLELVLPPVKELLQRGGEVVALIKPQFEVGRGEVDKGGVVNDPAKRKRAVEKIAAFAEKLGLEVMGTVTSPEVKPKSNVEYFIHLRLNA